MTDTPSTTEKPARQTLPLTDFLWFTPEEAAAVPDGICRAMKDHWWLVDDQGRIAFYNPVVLRTQRRRSRGFGSPQANRDERISRALSRRYPWAVDVVQLPLVFEKIDLADYR